jgi:hypothetical protein
LVNGLENIGQKDILIPINGQYTKIAKTLVRDFVSQCINQSGCVIGAIVFADSKYPERFTRPDVIQGESLAEQVSQTLKNSELFNQVQRLEEQYRIVTESLHDAVYIVDAA